MVIRCLIPSLNGHILPEFVLIVTVLGQIADSSQRRAKRVPSRNVSAAVEVPIFMRRERTIVRVALRPWPAGLFGTDDKWLADAVVERVNFSQSGSEQAVVAVYEKNVIVFSDIPG